MPAPREWRAAGEGGPRGSPRPTFLANRAPRSKGSRGSLGLPRWRWGTLPRPRSPPTEQGSGCPTPGCNSRRGGAGLSLPRGTWGYPATGTRRSEAPDRAQGAALTRSSALSLRTSSLAAEYELRDATSQRGQPPPTRPVCSVPSWTSGALWD